MDKERWHKINEVFYSALEVDRAQRTAFVAGACADDDDLRREVEFLLVSHDKATGFIQGSVMAEAAELLARETDYVEGQRVGPYRLIKEIGRGGMGSVYLAARDDEEYEKQVAIKFAQSGLGRDYLGDRFRKERQILANLDHPDIARLLDGGTTPDDAPYFVTLAS